MIHPTAVVSPKAELGDDVTVGPYCVISDDAVIGDRCVLHSHVVVEGPCTIGCDNEFYPFCTIGTRSQDLKYAGEPTAAHLGDHNTFREYVTVHRGTTAEVPTRIGSHNHLLAYAHAAHDSLIGDHCILSNGATLGGHVTVEDHVIISGLSGVHQFCRLGAHAMIGGCTKIVQDVPPFMIADGNPASIRGLNLVGLQRRGFSENAIGDLKVAYKALFLKKATNLSTSIEALASRAESHGPEVEELLAFLRTSKRGVIR